MANIDIAERLFVYAREKQQKDLANNLIKPEDVIDFSSADFNSFNQEISNMLGGLNNDQVNMFVHMLQAKMDHNITDVITPGEKGFSLNIPSIASTINQIKEHSENINDYDHSVNQQSESQASKSQEYNDFLSKKQKDIEELQKNGIVSEEFIDIYKSDYKEGLKKFTGLTLEKQEDVNSNYEKVIKNHLYGDKDIDIDYKSDIMKLLGFSKELLDEINSKAADKHALNFIINNLVIEIMHGRLSQDKKNIDNGALTTFLAETKAQIKDLYPEVFTAISQIDVEKVQLVSNYINTQSLVKESIIKDNVLFNSMSKTYDSTSYKVINEEDLALRYSSLIRSSIDFMGNLPSPIQEKIKEFIKENTYYDPSNNTFHYKDDIDLEKIKKSFTFDIESNLDLIEELGKNGTHPNSSPEAKKQCGENFLKELPNAMVRIIENTRTTSKILDSLEYTEDDAKKIKPFLEAFSKNGINLDDAIISDILNNSTYRDSEYTHVNVEALLKEISLFSKKHNVDFSLDTSQFEAHAKALTNEINKLSKSKVSTALDNSSFSNYDDMQKYDINHFSSNDFMYDDMQKYLDSKRPELKYGRAYKKLFPSTEDLVNGFKYDMDAWLLKTSGLDPDILLDIYTNPEKDSKFLVFASALSVLYGNGKENILPSIDIDQQKLNLEILKEKFLDGFEKSTLDSITVDTMTPVINALMAENMLSAITATSLSNHINFNQHETYVDFLNNGTISIDHRHPGFLRPESYQYYNDKMKKLAAEKEASATNITQVDDSKEDNHPVELKRPKGLVGFVSSFINKFRDTDKESGIFNRLKDSFNYARNSISDYSNINDEIDDKEGDFKQNQSIDPNKPAELDSFSQSLRNEYANTTQNVPNIDGKRSFENQKQSSGDRANSDNHDEIDI